MTLTQMQYFSTICECQNISMAAKMLCISQPALSATLAGMEEEIGFKLFERKSKGVYPTGKGRQLLVHVNAVLRRYRLLEREIPLIAKNQDVIRAGFRPYSGETTFFQVYKDFELRHKDVILKVNEMSNPTPYIYLEEKVFDFLVATPKIMAGAAQEKYERCLLGVEKRQIFCHRDSAPGQKGFLTLEDFAAYPFVFWEGHQSLLESINEGLAKQGRRMNVVAIVPQLTGILHFICNNLAAGFMTGDYLESIPNIREVYIQDELLPLTGGRSIPIYVYWKRDIEKYHSKKLFIYYLRTRAPADAGAEEGTF